MDLARIPVPHDKSLPPPVSPKGGLDAIDSGADESDCDKFISVNSTDSEYNSTENPILFSQKHLNDLIRDLCFSKEKAELLVSRLNERNMVEKRC